MTAGAGSEWTVAGSLYTFESVSQLRKDQQPKLLGNWQNRFQGQPAVDRQD